MFGCVMNSLIDYCIWVCDGDIYIVCLSLWWVPSKNLPGVLRKVVYPLPSQKQMSCIYRTHSIIIHGNNNILITLYSIRNINLNKFSYEKECGIINCGIYTRIIYNTTNA